MIVLIGNGADDWRCVASDQVGVTFPKNRVGKYIAKVEGPLPTTLERPEGRLPPIARYRALASDYTECIHQGLVPHYAEIATLGHATRGRVSQIMNLRLLVPEIDEKRITKNRVIEGRDSRSLYQFQQSAGGNNGKNQRKEWRALSATSRHRRVSAFAP